ncbi:MAG TPA: carboxypeptidase-like regulatory domain-containing protein [Candidatus Polarisedimenticolia bacterium]|nr:carboxypeptidase-like regulatory domain-containing protein [Candidatus Polarisedimenticolia bacterium]
MTLLIPQFSRVNPFAVKQFRLSHALLLCMLVFGTAAQTFGQNATIVGTVTDPSGSVIANVRITVTHVETNLTHTFTSNEAGQYVAVDLPVGHYNIKAEASGFKVAEQKGLVLQVGDRTRVDFQMSLGAASETVTVEANAVRVQADTGEVSNVIDEQQVSQLAVNGRSIYQLAALAPGASSQITGFVNTPVGGNASVEFNGMRQNHNIYLLDGGEDDDRGGAGGMSIAPSTDAIAEFRQLTSNYSADYGLSSAGTMTMVLKSGTSTLHASAWEFNRNDAFDARDFFRPAPATIQELRLNVYGFNVGGPVTFGKLYNPDRKKTFFFYNMEWRKLIQGGGTNQTVPDTAAYGGNLAGLLTASNPNPIFVPTFCAPGTCTGSNAQVAQSVLFANCPGQAPPAGITSGGQFPGNVIPSCMISPNATALLTAGVFPAPTTNIANSVGTFVGGANAPTNLREEVVRIDHNFSSKFSVFGHYVAEQVTQSFATSQWSGDNVPTVGDTFGNPSRSGVIHTTYAISPTLLNEVAFNYNGNVINIVPYAATGLKSLALPTGYVSTNSRLFTGTNNLNRIPNIDLSGGTGAQFEISSWPWHNKADDYQIRDDISLTKGTHQLKFGGSWAIYKKVQDLFGQTQGGFSFNNVLTAGTAACPANTTCGNSFASFLLGLPSSYQELAVQDSGKWNNVSWAAYVQDNWRVNKRLTLNLGLRWDGVPHTYEANNRMGNFYPSLYKTSLAATFNNNNSICGPTDTAATGCPGGASPGLGTSPNSILAGVPLYLNGIGIPGQNGVPKGLVNNHWAAFGPRLGFAYDLTGSGKTVVRGGFGIMYERIQGNDMYNAGPNIPFSLQVSLNNVEMTNPSLSLSTGTAAARPINAASITGLEVDNYKLPASYQYSVGVQHSFATKTVLSVSYVGNQSRHQNDYRNVNLPSVSYLPNLIAGAKYQTAPGLPFPGFTTVRNAENEANAHYNGLQIDLNSRLGRDLNLRAFYTLSRAIDPTTAGSGGGDLGTVSNPYAGWVYDVGPSGYDRTHVAVVDFIYDIPLLRHSQSRLVRSTVGGWQVSGIVTMESGVPLNVNLTGGQQGNGVGGNNRPNLTGTISYPKTPVAGVNQGIQYFDPTAFTAPAAGAWGTLGHNALRGPGRDNWNMSLFKTFTLSESRGSRFELRFESFNTWNHTQFNVVDTGLGNSRFGRFTSAFDPRILQLGGKIYF